jgi:hypothetical protein
MPKLIVNNPNIILESHGSPGKAFLANPAPAPPKDVEPALIRQLRRFRREVEELVCSAAWAEDCLFRGASYAPDFRCTCPNCRKFFPNRLHPRPFRESNYSIDCQIETNEDPEFAEEFARLRNDRPRVGSAFLRQVHIISEKNQISSGQ